jgi:hypothetical protein
LLHYAILLASFLLCILSSSMPASPPTIAVLLARLIRHKYYLSHGAL